MHKQCEITGTYPFLFTNSVSLSGSLKSQLRQIDLLLVDRGKDRRTDRGTGGWAD
jgi:hypothetical protein